MKVAIEGVTLTVLPDGRVSWASDWLAAIDLADRGILRRTRDRGCYGHIEFYYKGDVK